MAELQIIITGENQSSQAFSALKKDLGDVGAGADVAKEKGSGFFSGMLQTAGGFLAANVIGGIASQFTGFIGGAISDSKEAAQIMAQTEAVIKSTGGAAGMSAQQVQELAGSLSAAAGKSLFDDDDIQKGDNLLLTFTNIKETLPDATSVMVDMATAMHTDVSAGAIQLGKALNDPINGISALSRVGVTFTDEQKKQIKAMQEAGDMAGAQKVILAELNKEFGGSAAAAAKADGGMAQFKAQLGDVGKQIGGALLPVLGELTKFASANLIPVLQVAATWFADNLPKAITMLSDVWTSTLAPALKAVWGFISANLIPILQLVFAWLKDNLPPAIKQLSDYWTNVLRPALEQVWNFIQANVIPILDTLINAWFALMKVELKALATLWTNVLWPALQKVWEFIKVNVIPILAEAVVWLKDNLPPALRTLADFWTNVLLPALTAAWNFFTNSILPVLKAVADVLIAVVGLAVRTLAAIWNDVLLPPLMFVWQIIKDDLIPAFNKVASVLSDVFGPAISGLQAILTPAIGWFNSLSDAASKLVDFLQGVADAINNINVPSALGGGGGHATGTPSFKGGMTMVGEFGPELVALPQGSRIYTNSDTRNILNNHGGETYNFYFSDSVSSYDRARLERDTRSAMTSAGRSADYRIRTGG